MTTALPPVLCDMITSSLTELAADVGLGDVRPAPKAGASLTHAAVIGFTGAAVRGTMVVASVAPVLRESHPNLAMGMDVGEEEICDWVGELANQVLGRFKNKMVEVGHPFALGMPTLVKASDLSLPSTKDAARAEFAFANAHGPLTLTVEAIISPGTVFTPGATPKGNLSEGGGMLF